ncbi:MAG TPA: Ig-like domain repeat protein [Solirubrobacteraceae bacterium]|nr:Ig-like domain repeat protein [Solirubrobacteraceae bacterium]
MVGVLAVPSSAAALTDFTWSGAAGASSWSTAANWVGATAPNGPSGTLSFPALPGCTGTCYTSANDLTGASANANAISIDDGVPYQLNGNGLTLGAGGITAAPSGSDTGASANITLPLTLSAAQTWSITGGSSSQQLGVSSVAGAADALTVDFASGGILSLTDAEVGAVSLTGDGALGLFGSLNGDNGNPVGITSPARLATQFAGATSGPLTSTGGSIQVGRGLPLDGTLAVSGDVTLDSASNLTMFIDQPGTTPSTDYSQLTATGTVNLGGANLFLNNPAAACPALHVGDVDTLISTTGSLTGTFHNLPDGTTVPLTCTGTAPTVTINYTSTSVTATVASTAPGGTTTDLAASPTTAATNHPVTLTATVGPNSPAPDGTVEFDNNGTAISGCTAQPVTLTSGSYTATCSTSFAASPAPTLTATFNPSNSSGEFASTSSVAPLTITKDASTTTLTVSSATPSVGAGVTYTATVAPDHSGPAVASGSVQFLDNGTPIADCASQEALISGQATCVVVYPATGSHSISVSYGGDGNFTGSATSPQTVTVVPPVPQYGGTLPSISGNTTQGQTLTETHGTWTNSPTGYTYQWVDCDSAGNHCVVIAGATSQTYTLEASDVGHTIRVLEAAFNAGGPSPVFATSAPTGVVAAPAAPPTVPVSTSPPVITGATTVGRTLSTTNGGWSGTPPSGYSYQWQRCTSSACTNIAGANNTTYALSNSDLGMKVRVVVLAVNSVGGGVAVSNKVGPVVGRAQIEASLAKQLIPKGSAAKIGALLKAGAYTLSFAALESGRVVIGWYMVPAGAHLAKASIVLVASGSATFTSAGTKKLKLKLTAAGKKLLKRSKTLKLTAKATFSASGQTNIVARKTFTLKR